MNHFISRREFFKKISSLAAIGMGGSVFYNSGCRSKRESGILIKGGTLIDGNGSVPKKSKTIYIADGMIKNIDSTEKNKKLFGTKSINAKGKFIIPGLIDMHVHFVDQVFCKQFLNYGVTTVRDMGNHTKKIIALRDGINNNTISGPTIFTSGYLINNRKIPYGASSYTAVVDTPERARRVVQILAGQKVDWIKIYITLPPKLVRIVTQEAKKYNLPVAGHLRRVNAEKAAKWGMSSLEHTTGIAEALLGEDEYEEAPPLWTISNKTWLHTDEKKYDRLIDLLIKKNVSITANLTLYRSFTQTPKELERTLPENLMPKIYLDGWKNYMAGKFLEITKDRESWIETEKKVWDFILRFKNKGGNVIAGTDTPWPYLYPGYSLHEELGLLVEAGFTPMEALLTATKNASKTLRKLDQLGTIEEGKIANLVILDKNPLNKISHTNSINTVIKDGKIIPIKEL